MTENEAKHSIQWRIDVSSAIAGKGADGKALEDLEMAIQALEEIQAYREIGTIDEFKALKEKSVAKKPFVKGVMGFDGEEEYHCPNCNQKLMY